MPINRTLSAALFMAASLATFANIPQASADQAPDVVTMKYGERRAYFDDILAACRPGGYCSAITYVGARGDFYDYAVRVGSPAAGSPYEVIFTAVAEYVPDNGPIAVSVDNLVSNAFPARTALGWNTEQGKGVNEHVFAETLANSSLLPAMKRGYWMIVSFPRGDGVDAVNINSQRFSLRGLSAALNWIERNRMP